MKTSAPAILLFLSTLLLHRRAFQLIFSRVMK
jgi:hypothetical protein